MLSLAVLAAHEEELAPMIAHPLVFAGIALAVFVVLGFITWSYRDVANRHTNTDAPSDHQSSQH
jgi:hypothetical protein